METVYEKVLCYSKNKKAAVVLAKSTLNNGVDYSDTAYPTHGDSSEGFIVKLSHKKILKRKEVYLTIKLPNFSVHDKQDIEEIFQEHLKRLKAEYVDYYLLNERKSIRSV